VPALWVHDKRKAVQINQRVESRIVRLHGLERLSYKDNIQVVFLWQR
jgi:hypothetical protein